MIRVILGVALMLSLSGCGRLERWWAGISGGGTEVCVDGVLYLQFTSGVTVKYLPDGRIATCRL